MTWSIRKYLALSKVSSPKVLSGTPLQPAVEAQYLCTTISASSLIDPEIRNRATHAFKRFLEWRRKSLHGLCLGRQVKVLLLKQFLLPMCDSGAYLVDLSIPVQAVLHRLKVMAVK